MEPRTGLSFDCVNGRLCNSLFHWHLKNGKSKLRSCMNDMNSDRLLIAHDVQYFEELLHEIDQLLLLVDVEDKNSDSTAYPEANFALFQISQI